MPLIKMDRLPLAEYKRLDIYPICKKRPTHFSVQWSHLLAKDARIIAETPLEPYVQWIRALNNRMAQNYVYDEVVPCAMLQAQNVKLKDEPLTAMERRNVDDPSPIVWNTLNSKYIVNREVLEDGEIEEPKFSLKEVLQEYIADEFVFFRKVSAMTSFDVMPWAL
jgi:hypothetical protein